MQLSAIRNLFFLNKPSIIAQAFLDPNTRTQYQIIPFPSIQHQVNNWSANSSHGQNSKEKRSKSPRQCYIQRKFIIFLFSAALFIPFCHASKFNKTRMIPIHPRLKMVSWQGLKERNRADHQEYKTEIEGKRKSAAKTLCLNIWNSDRWSCKHRNNILQF